MSRIAKKLQFVEDGVEHVFILAWKMRENTFGLKRFGER